MTKDKLGVVLTEAAMAAEAGGAVKASDALKKMARAIADSPAKNVATLLDSLSQASGESG